MHIAITKALGLYINVGLILLPYFPNNGLEINAAKAYTPKTKPDWDSVAPFEVASAGKNGGSIEPQIPQLAKANPNVNIINIIFEVDKIILLSIVNKR